MTRSERVTVYIPTYNRLRLLKRALSSVLNQTHKNLDVVVVDDDSSDGTIGYLESVRLKDNRLRLYQKSKFGGKKGACASRNLAITKAKGHYVTGLDDDDYFLPNHIESLLEAWRNSPRDVFAVYSDVYMLKNGQVVEQGKRAKSVSARALIYGNWIGNQIFTKTSCLREIGGFDESFPAWQDLDCWYRLLKKNNGSAICSGARTCVLDAEHEFERISSKTDNVSKSAEFFLQKHNINRCESRALKTQLYFYNSKNISFLSLVCKIFGLPTFYNVRNSLIMVYLHFKSRSLND
jgi:glycosyltransferase involved in cell wall biosynthesis